MLKEALEHNNFVDNDVLLGQSAEKRAIWNEMFVCRAEMEEIFKNNPSTASVGTRELDVLCTIASFLLVRVSEYNNPFDISFNDLGKIDIDGDIISFVMTSNIDGVWSKLLALLNKHEQNIFALNVLLRNASDPNATPIGITDLATILMDVKPDINVAELCCGPGVVIDTIKEAVPSIKATGYEVDLSCIAVAKARNYLSANPIAYVKSDVFNLVNSDNIVPQYDRIFANYPFGQRLRDLNAGKGYLSTLTQRIPSMSKATSSDWLYNMLITEMLSKDGRAVGIMTNGSTWNMIDAPIRQYFIENGLIECVIALPAKLFYNTSIATSMIVLSHGNKGVRLVDASEQFTAGRRTNELSESDVDAIISMIETDSEKSFFVDNKTLSENDYVLNTNRYIIGADSSKEGIAFESIIKRITRGAPMNARQLDDLSSNIPTNMQYLMISNIQDGLIDSNLPYLSRVDKKNEKYCLSDRCLIMSKNGFPYKVAVAEVKNNQQIMANGNLYIIELDLEKVDPYYLAAFFSSENGTALLKSISVGATVPNIGVEQLKKLSIPLPSIEEQKKIADEYKRARDEIMMLQLKLEKARNRMMHIFEEEV